MRWGGDLNEVCVLGVGIQREMGLGLIKFHINGLEIHSVCLLFPSILSSLLY